MFRKLLLTWLLTGAFAICKSQIRTPVYDFDAFTVTLDETHELSPTFGKDSSWFEAFDVKQKQWTMIFFAIRSTDLDPVISIRSAHGNWDTLIRLTRNRQPFFIPRLIRTDDSLSFFVFAAGNKQKGTIEVAVLSENLPYSQQPVQKETSDGLDMMFATSYFLYYPLFHFKEDTSSSYLKIYDSRYRIFGKKIERATLKEGPPVPVLFTVMDNNMTLQQATDLLKSRLAEIRNWAAGRPEVHVEWVDQYGTDKLPAILFKRKDPLSKNGALINYARMSLNATIGYYFIGLESDVLF